MDGVEAKHGFRTVGMVSQSGKGRPTTMRTAAKYPARHKYRNDGSMQILRAV